MINIDFLNIKNSKIVGRLLPFWLRGRKVSLLIQALLSPIVSVHNAFKAWALEKYIYCHISAQPSSIEWYLKYKLGKHFEDSDAGFGVSSGLNEKVACFSTEVWRDNLYWHNDMQWGVYPAKQQYTDEELRNADKVVVTAPRITATINYTEEDYKRDIRFLMSHFMLNFKEIVIKIDD